MDDDISSDLHLRGEQLTNGRDEHAGISGVLLNELDQPSCSAQLVEGIAKYLAKLLDDDVGSNRLREGDGADSLRCRHWDQGHANILTRRDGIAL